MVALNRRTSVGKKNSSLLRASILIRDIYGKSMWWERGWGALNSKCEGIFGCPSNSIYVSLFIQDFSFIYL